MTAHNHRAIVPGCYRCELGQDEARAAAREQLIEDAAKAIHEHDPEPYREAGEFPPDLSRYRDLAEAALAVFEGAHAKDLAASPKHVKNLPDSSHVTPTDDERETLIKRRIWKALAGSIQGEKDGTTIPVPVEDIRVLLSCRTVQGEASDDEREALASQYAREHGDSQTRTDFLAGWDARAGRRRTVQGEPTPLARMKGALGEGQVIDVPRESQGEPSDAQVEAGARALFEEPGHNPDSPDYMSWDDVVAEDSGRAAIWRDDARRVVRAALRAAAYVDGTGR